MASFSVTSSKSKGGDIAEVYVTWTSRLPHDRAVLLENAWYRRIMEEIQDSGEWRSIRIDGISSSSKRPARRGAVVSTKYVATLIVDLSAISLQAAKGIATRGTMAMLQNDGPAVANPKCGA